MSKGRLVAVCMVWLVIAGITAVIWKYVIAPARNRQTQQQQKEVIAKTGSQSRYQNHINLRLDSFSGYAPLRSEQFRNELAAKKIDIKLDDDQADYVGRLKALRDGDAQMAVFTIDALIKASAEMNEMPATIVAILDETTGADAIVAYKATVPNVDALNRADTKFVLTGDSPSETLARAVMSSFQLDKLAAEPFIKAKDAEDVFRRYKQAKPTDQQVYVLWEPFVSKVLENPATHVLVDSSNFPSTIVDVLVASRDFLIKNEEVAQDVVEAYLRVIYHYRDPAARVRLVMDDARRQKVELSEKQAQKLVEGIWWKNTQENLAHVGLPSARPLPHVEDMILNITSVLTTTHAIQSDPTGGQPNALYLDKILKNLQNFHPGDESEDIRDVKLPTLSDEEWQKLEPVGTVRMPELVFSRGTDRLTEQSKVVLDDLAQKLTTTRYYCVIRGNASRVGDLEANKQLAARRAKAAEQYLLEHEVDPVRIRAIGVEPSGATSVSFSLGQMPY